MTNKRELVLQRLELQTVKEDALVKRIKNWLGRDDTKLVADRSSKVSVSEASRLWNTRLKNTVITGQKLEGADSLLKKFDQLTPQSKLEQFAFVGPETAGNLFFEGSSHQFVGAVLFRIEPKQTTSSR